MLAVIQSNRLETLADALAQTLRDVPLGPFEPEVVIVPSAGIGRWLSFALAERLGVAANLRFVFAAGYAWSLFASVLGDIEADSPFEPEPLAWRLFDLLGRERRDKAFEPVRRYLADHAGDSAETRALRRFELATRIAGVFDGYLVQRPDWLERWGRGELLGLGADEGWQAALWREIATALRVADKPHPRERFFAALEDDLTARAVLPQRLHLFALSALPPLYLDTFRRLGEYLAVNVFALNPGGLAYWGDIRRRTVSAAGPDAPPVGNALLASWGRHAQAFFDALADAPSVERFEDPGPATALAVLQSDILHLRDRGAEAGDAPALALAVDDRSLGFAVCHSPTREVEALQDWLLDAFERDPSLAPSDVLVLVPDLDAYASAIGSVFGSAPESRRIAFTIADRGLVRASAIARALLRLLSLPRSRLDAETVLALLDTNAVARRFGLLEADVAVVRRWVHESGIRWGRDAAALESLGFPASGEHTWRHGLDRMLLGYAMREEAAALYRGRLAYDPIEGTEARALGALATFADAVFALEQALREPRSAARWAALLEDVQERFLAPALDELDEAAALRRAVLRFADEARRGGCESPMPLAVVRRELEARLAPETRVESFLAGGVTFAALRPNRPVPARVVVLLGMNDGAFPRQSPPPSFDLGAQAPRRGDRVLRDEARYALLEALLGARERLLVSWTGRSARDNAAKPPSVVVSELRDVVGRSFIGEDGGDALGRLTTLHPLQAFSRSYFVPDRDPRLWSYAEQYAEASRVAIGAQVLRAARRVVPAPLAPPALETEISLEQLVRGVQDPARRFLRDRLGIVLGEGEAALETSEPFVLDKLQEWTLRTETYALMLHGASREAAEAVARERGRLPHGATGEAAFHACLGEVLPVVERMRSAGVRGGQPPLPFRIEVGGATVRGTLRGRFAHGLALGIPGTRRARHWLEAWIMHLVFHLADPDREHVTEQHALGGTIELQPIVQAHDQLAALVQLWQRAAERPLPLFCESSFAYARALIEGADALQAARKRFEPGADGEGGYPERERPYIELAWRGVEDPLDAEFAALAAAVFLPVLEHMRESL